MSTAGKSAGSSIQLSDLQDWYTTFNSFASSFGTSSMQKSMTDTVKPTATDYNTLVNLVTAYRADTYLSTVTWPNPATVSAGTTMQISSAHAGINNIRTVQNTVKCRNNVSYNNQKKSNGGGERVCGSESYYNEGHISLSNTYYNCCQSRYYYTTAGNSNGYNGNGSGIDILNVNTSQTQG